MRIVFITYGMENLGIEYLSAVLKPEGHDVSVAVDPMIGTLNPLAVARPSRLFSRALFEQIRRLRPEIIGISVTTDMLPYSLELAGKLKEVFAVPVLVGGFHASIAPESAIENSAVDYVVWGEGERVLPRLLERIEGGGEPAGLDGVWYKKDGGIVRPTRPCSPPDIDRLPWPDKSLFADHIRIHREYWIISARGCPRGCSFCSGELINRYSHYRFRSPGGVLDELREGVRRFPLRGVRFFDSMLNHDEEWLLSFLEGYRREIRLPFYCQGHLDLDRNTIRALKESHCAIINFGMETKSERVRREVLGRSERNIDLERAVAMCEEVGLNYTLDYLAYIPARFSRDEYLDEIRQFTELRHLKAVHIYTLYYQPGSTIIDYAVKEGYLKESDRILIESGRFNNADQLYRRNGIRIDPDMISTIKALKVLPLVPRPLRGLFLRDRIFRWMRALPALAADGIYGLNFLLRRRDARSYLIYRIYVFWFVLRWMLRAL